MEKTINAICILIAIVMGILFFVFDDFYVRLSCAFGSLSCFNLAVTKKYLFRAIIGTLLCVIYICILYFYK